MNYFVIMDEIQAYLDEGGYTTVGVWRRRGNTLRYVRSRAQQVPPLAIDGHEYRRRQRARKHRKR